MSKYFEDPFAGLKPEGIQQTLKFFDYDSHIVNENKNIFNYDNFKPWAFQNALIKALEVYKVKRGFLILPRRAGKTHSMIVYMIRRALEKALTTDLPNLSYAIAYQELQSGKGVAWEHMCNITKGLPRRRTNSQQGIVDFTIVNAKGKEVKIALRILGLKNIHAKRGLYFDGLVIDERGYIMQGWEPIIEPTLTDMVRAPTWLIMIGTPSSANGFWEDYDKINAKYKNGVEGYFAFHGNYDTLKHITPEAREDMKEKLSPDMFEIEVNCKRGGTSSGTFYPEELDKATRDGRITKLMNDTNQGKIMVCDIGSSKSDKFAIWVYQYNEASGMIQAVDYTEIANATPQHIAEFAQRGHHRVHQFILPWDGASGFGTTTQDQLQVIFPNAEIKVLPRGKKLDGIRAGRSFMNMVQFDAVNCHQGLECLRNHSKVFDAEKQVYVMDSKHDRWSHGADGFRYSAEAYQNGYINFDNSYNQMSNSERNKPVKPYNPMSELQG